jgi:hypothetical protein
MRGVRWLERPEDAEAGTDGRPVTFQEIEDSRGFRHSLDIAWAQGKHCVIALCGLGEGVGVKDAIDLLFEGIGFGVGLGIVGAVDLFDMFLDILQGIFSIIRGR